MNVTHEQLDTFIQSCQLLIDEHYKIMPILEVPKLMYTTGKRFIKVIKKSKVERSVYCFIDIDNGDVLKPASWAAPAKHARGNLNDPDKGMKFMSSFGPAYLR